ncbi:MAG: LysM peptidoglycan-binding domain-containing protein, partial [Anaerolineales bacterium]
MECIKQGWYNAEMRNKSIFALIFIIIITNALTACAQEKQLPQITATVTQAGTLRPYPSNTVTITPLPTGYSSPTATPTITPSPTPVIYEVQTGDDMYSIAFRFNISPEVLMTANPSVNPRAMSVGTSLRVPITPMPDSTPTSVISLSPTPTMRFRTMQEPDCYPDTLGGLWCFVLVINRNDGALENVSGVVTLEQGEDQRQEDAIMPLNLLPAGAALPLIAYFDPPISEMYAVEAEVSFLLPVMPDDRRYLPISIVNQVLELRQDGQVAKVTGEINWSRGQSDVEYLWIQATAFDELGHVVAARRWEAELPLPTG